MLKKVWGKGNPPTLLVGLQVGVATMENSIKKLIELLYDLAIPLLDIYPGKMEDSNLKRSLHSMFTAALFTIFKT